MINSDLRRTIARIVQRSKEGHIPSSFSIVDIINFLYSEVLAYDVNDPTSPDRDYFILSKGHGSAGFFVVLHKYGFLTDKDLDDYGIYGGILGGHPDTCKVPGAEASTGSLGHGFPFATGIALALKQQRKKNQVVALVGDGECNEGTIWEAALVGNRYCLSNLTLIVDYNGSAAQILPVDPIVDKWKAFGWHVVEADGHSNDSMRDAFSSVQQKNDSPSVIIAHTVKGKGVSFIEGHGKWHHKIPTEQELSSIEKELI